MTRLSATATIAALLLLAIAQGFGATKVTSKAATKSTAKPYHITAQNQFHFKPSANSHAKTSKARKTNALDRMQTKAMQKRVVGPHSPDGKIAGRGAAMRSQSQLHGAPFALARPHTANPPTGHAGFVSATQVPVSGDDYGALQTGTLNGSTAFVTVVWTGTACAYAEVTASGTGTFTSLPATGTPETPVASGATDCFNVNFVFGDVNGDGNSDIVKPTLPGACPRSQCF